MAYGIMQWQKIYFLGQASLESLGTTSTNRATLPGPDDR